MEQRVKTKCAWGGGEAGTMRIQRSRLPFFWEIGFIQGPQVPFTQ